MIPSGVKMKAMAEDKELFSTVTWINVATQKIKIYIRVFVARTKPKDLRSLYIADS